MTSASCVGTVRVFVLVPARIDKRGLADEHSDLEASSFLNVSLTAARADENILDRNDCQYRSVAQKDHSPFHVR